MKQEGASPGQWQDPHYNQQHQYAGDAGYGQSQQAPPYDRGNYMSSPPQQGGANSDYYNTGPPAGPHQGQGVPVGPEGERGFAGGLGGSVAGGYLGKKMGGGVLGTIGGAIVGGIGGSKLQDEV
ncbi:glutamine-serine rich protein MS8 [Penicillium macrosclerotiorum]|uniref:glutamine-serine rich protein MS8 n=1 Tax=Penicillium macrosclerotiorum TaxID=303699 RepID=UPI00254847B6|nr:glutamine-serine rich protein MS8 [Penicillium macrosclerotiorum]KAJ5689608.1 glutamine-serine rich protein MS8 [Penicillium macrosclerotiorum]